MFKHFFTGDQCCHRDTILWEFEINWFFLSGTIFTRLMVAEVAKGDLKVTINLFIIIMTINVSTEYIDHIDKKI